MGEIADMMLEGILCCVCGEYLGKEEVEGYPCMCAGCALEAGEDELNEWERVKLTGKHYNGSWGYAFDLADIATGGKRNDNA